MAWTNALDNATPAGTDAPSVIDDQLRLIKAAVQERLNTDHFWPLTGTAVSDTDAGKHRKVTAQAVLGVKPTLLTGEAALYTKTVSGVSEWFWEDSAGTEHQLTNAGKINIESAEILGLLPNDTYLTAVDNAGTGTTDLIKAGQNEALDTDVAILPDLTRMVTSAAPLEDTAIANKKYVDDLFATLAFGDMVSVNSVGGALASGTTYKADCDGFVMANTLIGNITVAVDELTNPPTTIRRRDADNDNTWGGVTVPVKKDHYVKVVATSLSGYYWMPIGTGGLVAQ
jgi:hypothetical protein